MKEGMRPERQIEGMVLSIFTIYDLGIFSVSVTLNWSIWGSTLIVGSLIAGWIVYVGQYSDYRFRTMFVTWMMQITMCMFAMNVKEIRRALPIMATFVVVTGLYGLIDLMGIYYVTTAAILFYYVIVKKQLSFESSYEMFGIIIQFLNMLILESIVRFWLKKREATNVQFVKTIEELRVAEQSKDDFLANVSHEIRTPINTICGMSQVVLQEDNIEKMREDVRYIQTAGKNLMSVVSDVLDFSELQSGKIAMEEEAYNITSTINDVVNMTLAKIEEKSIELIVDCDATLPCSLLGDEKKIRRVIMNLVDNAIKFTEEGCVSIQISYRKEEYGINLIITVKDTGIGMKEESLQKIFSSFSQIDTRRNRQTGGVGLGLAISQAVVRMMGGIITIKSKHRKGTFVRFVVPQKVLDERPIASLEHKEELNISVYVNMEQFEMTEIRDEYSNNIQHMLEQMQVKNHVCRNLSELKRREEYENFTHVFIGMEEYKEDKEYFDCLSMRTKVIMILYRSEEKELSNANILRIYKPFYIIPIVLMINGQLTGIEGQYSNKKKRMFAPEIHALVVDDNVMNLKVMEGILERYQMKVSTATSGKSALEKINTKSYDMVFMDHMMPEMDGVETLHQIRKKSGMYFETVPVVAVTANAIAGVRETFLAEGFTDFLEKPVESSVLERVLMRNLPKEKVVFVERGKEREETKEKEREVLKVKETIEHTEEFSVGDLDVEKGLLYCGGKEKYIEVLKLSCDTIKDNQEQVEELFQQNNWEEYTIMVHGIKSSMLSIGAVKLSGLAKQLEMAGKEGKINYILENHKEMMTEYERVAKILQEHPLICPQEKEKTAEQDFPELEDEQFEQNIAELEDAMYNLDETRMIELLTNLERYQYDGVPLYKAMESVIRKVKMSDYMSAVETVSRLRNNLQKKKKGGEQNV